MTTPSTALGASAAGAETGSDSLESPELLALDQMSTKPSTLAMSPRVTHLGGRTYLIEVGQVRIVTDPGFDPRARNAAKAPGTC